MPEPDQTTPSEQQSDSHPSVLEAFEITASANDSADLATSHKTFVEAIVRRSLLWLAAGVGIAVVVGAVFGLVPTRLRLLGLLAILEGYAVGKALGRAARPLRMHHSGTATVGGLLCGILSVSVSAILWWQTWATQAASSVTPRPDVAMAAQMLAQMPQPDDGDPERLKAYEESRRQLEAFLASEVTPPKHGFGDWLSHRASALKAGRNASILIGVVELILAGLASSLLTRSAITSPFCSACQDWRHIIRFQAFSAPLPEPLKQLIPELIRDSASSVIVELSACGCDGRPAVNLNVHTSDQQSDTQLIAVTIADTAFADLKGLLDEAQGMK